MPDDASPFDLVTPARPARYWFMSPGEPRDYKSFQALCEAALSETREALLTDARAAALLAAIGKHGREGHIIALESHVAKLIAERLSKTPTRQRIKSVAVRYHAVPLPKSGRLEGTLIVTGWTHTLRSTFDPVINPFNGK